MRTLENSNRLRERVGEGDRAVVVGSGFIGCEAAASLSLRGAKVTLISLELSPQKARLGEEVGERRAVAGWLRRKSSSRREYRWHHMQGRRLQGFCGERRAGRGRHGPLRDRRESPYGARGKGRARGGGGIITDSAMRTSGTGVFAVGDVAQAYNDPQGAT